LHWDGAPADVKSFAVRCYDPDAPTGSGFWHWVIVNIPADVNELPLGAGNPASSTLPAGAMDIRNDMGTPGYIGRCPPEGDHPHRYVFTIFAVSTETLPVTADTTAAVVGYNLHFTTLEKASLMGLYKR
jgi:Raf kinase inhibitor-like YbhB/YbcL family protein